MVERIPPLHILVGKDWVSSPVQGAPPNGTWLMVLKHRWQIPRCIPVAERSAGSPASIRNPYSSHQSSPISQTFCQRSTHRFKSSNSSLPIIRRNIIHRHAPIGCQSLIRHLRHTFQTPIPSSEVHIRSPIIREIFRESTCRTARLTGLVISDGRHVCLEWIPTDDLMKMRGWRHGGVHERVQTLDDELGTGESHHGLCGGVVGEEGHEGEEGLQLHLEWWQYEYDPLKRDRWETRNPDTYAQEAPLKIYAYGLGSDISVRPKLMSQDAPSIWKLNCRILKSSWFNQNDNRN